MNLLHFMPGLPWPDTNLSAHPLRQNTYFRDRMTRPLAGWLESLLAEMRGRNPFVAPVKKQYPVLGRYERPASSHPST